MQLCLQSLEPLVWKDVPSHVIIISLRLFVFVSPRSDKSQVKSKVITPRRRRSYSALLLTAAGAEKRLFYGSKKSKCVCGKAWRSTDVGGMNVWVVGCGAMGSIYSTLLASSGNNVSVIDVWKDHVQVIRYLLY